MRIEYSDRLKKLPPYLFVEIDRRKKEALREGRDIIDFGIGDPDRPTPSCIVESMKSAVSEAKMHRYPLDEGLTALREEIALWYKDRFGVRLNPETEILPLIGSKEGIAHIPLAFMNDGDYALIPDPCYPPYRSGVIFAGGIPHEMALLKENAYLPDLGGIDRSIAAKSKIMFLNYPNNPTSAVADINFFKDAVAFAEENNIIICHDAAYSEIAFDGFKPASFLSTPGAMDVGVEFHSLSKTYNMTGWRIGWVSGNADVIKGLKKVKSNIDSGVFGAVQLAAIAAMKSDPSLMEETLKLYHSRRDILVEGLDDMGWSLEKPKATFYVWADVPSGHTSMEFSKMLLDKCDIVATPGVGFGPNGEGYIRFALTVDERRIGTALERIKALHDGR
ncbi:MAG: LL-diaminopimelate aminotransferase [Candidatus Omnitrophica bacterium CG1_02_49_10]|nr:MAG: LL-diaminopimelate aminotransferase [Candidatus Omnitrophica bacterium CG1_02_49_10]